MRVPSMLKFFNAPLVRISFGLVTITVCVLLASDMLGLVPDTRTAELKSRTSLAETLAVQFSMVIAEETTDTVEKVLRFIVQRNEEVLSAGVRRDTGDLLLDIGGHSRHWTLQPGDRSSPTQIQVALFDKEGLWGTMEVRFADLAGTGWMYFWGNSFFGVIGLVAFSTFIGYLLFLKRTMRELDPGSVVPERVRVALDTLAEGLLIVDHDGRIMFSNEAFATKTGLRPDNLVGRESSSLPWEMSDESPVSSQLPWFSLLAGRELPEPTTVRLKAGLDTAYTFAVNSSQISSAEGKIRGALITFDDVTEMEKKNDELKRTLGKLERSQHEIMRQNQRLDFLATRDPLTGLLNRRSLFQGFDVLFMEAWEGDEDLACIMVDIDKFKSVNDRFGHAAGDKALKLLAKVLSDCSRPTDLVGRFGGEEFCIALPAVSRKDTATIAERMRQKVQNARFKELGDGERITSSFGISNLSLGAASVAELVDQADKALYVAKNGGRNRVVNWSRNLADNAPREIAENPVSEGDSASDGPESNGQTTDGAEESKQLTDAMPEVNTNLDSPVTKQPIHGRGISAVTRTRESNRFLLFDRLSQAILRAQRSKTHIAVITIDYDALQRVNETLGFSVGEKFANTVVTLLKGTLRSSDTILQTGMDELLFSVSRPDGNEMVVLLTDLKTTDVVAVILQRFFDATSAPIDVEGMEVYLDADVGVTLYPLDGEDTDTLLSCAYSSMREAKKLVGRNNFQFFSANINRHSKQQLRLEADLHRALERGELVIHYQPKVDLKGGSIIGVEALLRWQHPRLGIIPPNEFIPIAEQSGLIDRISHRVIRTACRQIMTWQQAGYGALKIAVNLSPVEFRNPELADQIIAIVNESGISPNLLEIEITETVVMQNMDLAIEILTKLDNAGLAISLDDFGTGYSTFNYLKKFPLSKIKIDRSFVSDFERGPDDAALVSVIIAMGHSLGLEVVAEGVETEDQLRFLQDLHCDEVQGFLFSQARPVDEISRLLSSPESIKSLILEYEALAAEKGGSVMMGILNEFPALMQTKAQRLADDKNVETGPPGSL